MTSKRIRKAAMAWLALSLLMALAARADSAANQHVSVSCAAPGVSVTVDGNRFDIFAPGYPESFAADVMVVAVNGWVLIKPKASALPLKMKGGDTSGYEVEGAPEDEASGTIAFHNYHIKSNRDGGAKDIIVPAGASVTYTAYRNGAARRSDWSVNGQVRNDTSNIIFNRNWWNVPAWFIPSMDTPVAGAYGITAKDVDTPVLTDSGSMKVVGVHRISGPKGKESDRIDPPSGGTTWQEGEVIYAQPCAAFDFVMELEPSLSADEFNSIKGSLSWSAGSGRITPDNADPRAAEHCAPKNAGMHTVTASCGESRRIIRVKVGVPKIHKVSFSDNIGIGRDLTGIFYTAPAWQDNNLDGISDLVDANANANKPYQPVAYLSTRNMVAESEFLPDCTKVSNPAERIVDYDVEAAVQKLRFAPNNSIWGWDWSTPVAFGMKGTVVTAASPFRAAPEVGYESAYELAWEVGFGEAGTADGGLTWKRSSSEHELYLTYNAEVSSFETVFHLSCTSANGKKTDTSVVDGVWSGFTGRNVKRKDGAELTYYKSYRNGNSWHGPLLSNTDGECGAWAHLFRETLAVHGIPAEWKLFKPLAADGFIVKTWSFYGSGTSGDPDFPYRNELPLVGDYVGTTQYYWGSVAEVTYTSGTPGQNNNKPASLFENHQVVYVPVMNAWYDPSYGIKHTTEQSIDNTLSGFYIDIGNAFFIQTNPVGVQIQFP